MTEPNLKPDRNDETGDWVATYRCVCGEMVSPESVPPTCAKCGRKYDADVLHAATAETTVINSDSAAQEDKLAADSGCEKDELLGRQLGHFRILARIGSGGMGSVYRALDESLQRYVALKVLRTSANSPNDVNLQGLFREARAQARVNHPHVAHIYFVGSDAETPYLAMELVGHETLADRMKEGPLPFHLIVRYAQQIAKALEAAAKFDIVHSDVKPANVLMVDDQTVKLSDFGLASRLSETAVESNTTAGTPDYMPPEATQGCRGDHRGDMYSLGVVLFEMTFGRLPYTPSGKDVLERLRLHREATVEFPDPWPTTLPLAWRDLLARLLEKSPEKRYTDFADLIANLKRLEPATLPAARPLIRGCAWLFDGFILSLPLAIIALLSSGDPLTVFPLLGTISSSVVVIGICLLQAWWGTTPGKRLFQIRIVDQHGLSPRKSVLGARAAFQFAWTWSTVVARFLQLLTLGSVGQWINGVVVLFLLAEMGFVLFGKGRSIHDRILHTRVVLDAGIKLTK